MIPDGWSIDQFENGNIMFSHPQHGGLCIAHGNAVHALCDALLRSEQERCDYRDAVDRELTTLGTCVDAYESPTAAVRTMIDWHVQIALDPAVSSDASALVERGRQERSEEERDAARYRYLRDAFKRHDMVATQALFWNTGNGKAFDRAIDAAMAKGDSK